MTRQEALDLHMTVRYNLPNTKLKEAVDVAFGALEQAGWVSVEEAMPDDWVSVLGYMTDAGEFPPVRECYAVDGNFWFPALREFHPVSHWMPMPTKED